MTSLIESYERRSYKNDPFFSSGVQYVTKEGLKEEEEGKTDQSDQPDDKGEDGEHYFGNGDEEILREEKILLLAGIPVFQDSPLVYEDSVAAYEDTQLGYDEAPHEEISLDYESTSPNGNLLLAPIPEYEVLTDNLAIEIFVIVKALIVIIVTTRKPNL